MLCAVSKSRDLSNTRSASLFILSRQLSWDRRSLLLYARALRNRVEDRLARVLSECGNLGPVYFAFSTEIPRSESNPLTAVCASSVLTIWDFVGLNSGRCIRAELRHRFLTLEFRGPVWINHLQKTASLSLSLSCRTQPRQKTMRTGTIHTETR